MGTSEQPPATPPVAPAAALAMLEAALDALNAADAASLDRVGPAAIALAEAEGLNAHARSIALRLQKRA